MAISVDWGTKVINVPKVDWTLVSGANYTLDTDAFRLALKVLEASEEGMPFLDTHEHTAPKTLGGVTYARFVEIINGYTVTFEAGPYRVTLQGSNNNILDVTNINQTSVSSTNSAGLIVGEGASATDIANAVWNALRSDYVVTGSMGEGVNNILGLLHNNSVVDNFIYDANNILTSARIRVFADNTTALAATDGGIGEGEIAEFAIDGESSAGKTSLHRLVTV